MSICKIILLRIQFELNSFGGVSERDTVTLPMMKKGVAGGEREREAGEKKRSTFKLSNK